MSKKDDSPLVRFLVAPLALKIIRDENISVENKLVKIGEASVGVIIWILAIYIAFQAVGNFL